MATMPAIFTRNRRAFAGAGLVVIGAMLAWLVLPNRGGTVTLDPATFRPEEGDCYNAPVRFPASFPFGVTWDTMSNRRRSMSVLLENGRPLGPGHALHADIRAEGEGRYAFWAGTLYFSASDDSDPRSNGRTYSVRYSLSVAWEAYWGLGLLAALLIALFADPPDHWRKACDGRALSETPAAI
jgi:hypothetical protein